MTSLAARLLASAVCATALFATPAAAQRVDRIIAFGDSYADDGNFFQLVPPAYSAQAQALYPTGRFSGGTNFVDTMGQILAVPIDNFAIGGAFTGNGNINGVGGGFVTEYQSFLAGGGPAAFPRVSGTFSANDLVVVSIGGNDARAYERSLGVNPTQAQITGLLAGVPAQASARVTEAMTGVNALVNAGARNFTFLAGDVGRLPEVVGLPIAQVGTAYASAFNAGMRTQLAAVANQGVIVNWVDLNRVGDVVQANLSAFGLTSAGACPATCVLNPELQAQYLFYVDQVHLTSRGFQIVGQYAVRQLEAPLQLEAQAETGLEAARSFASTLTGRLDLSAARFGGGHTGLNFWVSGNVSGSDRDASDRSLDFEADSSSASGGVEYDSASGVIVGAAVAWTRADAGFSTRTGEIEADGWQGGVYAGWRGGGAFVQGYAGVGSLDYEIEREAVIDDIAGETDGNTLVTGGRAGYLMNMGRLQVGPVLGMRYVRAELDAFTETGDPVLTLNVDDQEASSLTGSAGVELRGNLQSGDLSVQPYLTAAVEREFEGDARTIRYALTAAPEIVNSWTLPERSRDTYGRIGGGVSLSLGGGIALQVHGSATIGQDGGREAAGSAALKIGF